MGCGKVKEKPGSGICLLLLKNTGRLILTSTSDGRIDALTINAVLMDLGFRPSVYGAETSDSSSAPPSLLITVRERKSIPITNCLT